MPINSHENTRIYMYIIYWVRLFLSVLFMDKAMPSSAAKPAIDE